MKPYRPRDTRSVWTKPVGHLTVKLLLAILISMAAVAVGYVLISLRLVVIPVLIALILAAAIRPLVHFLQRRSAPKPVATLVALLTSLGIFLGLGATIAYSVYAQRGELTVNSNIGLARLEEAIADSPLPFNEQELRQARQSAVESFTNGLSVDDAFFALNAVGTFLTGLFLLIVALFFFLKDGSSMWEFVTKPLHGDRHSRTLRAGQHALGTLGGYLRGITTIAAIDAAGIGIAMFLLGVPLAVPLTAIVFLGGFVPVIGATITGIFAVLVAFVTNGPGTALILGIVVVAVQQLEGNLLQPVIMGRSVKLHPLVVLLSLTAGAILAGIIGAVLAVPITAAAWSVARNWNAELTQRATPEPTTRIPDQTAPEPREAFPHEGTAGRASSPD